MSWERWSSPDAPRSTPPPKALDDVVDRLASSRGWGKRLRGARIHGHWEEIAGEELARHVQPVRLAGGVLVVRAESAAWATQVSYLTAELAQRANEVLGDGEVTSVTVQLGRPERRTSN